ncbi:MAG: hypothetical protein JJ863_38470 [Deltaproteobacteria bacterium]|nr:hypothetical protein [Deltaproteobacteria bacterium]
MIFGYAACSGAIVVGAAPRERTIDLSLAVTREALVRVSELRRGNPLNMRLEINAEIYADGQLIDFAYASVATELSAGEWLKMLDLVGLATTFLVELPTRVAETPEHPTAGYFRDARQCMERRDHAGALVGCRRALEAAAKRSADRANRRLQALLCGEVAAQELTVAERAEAAEEALRLLLNAGAHHVEEEPSADEAAFALAVTAAVLRLYGTGGDQ